MVVVVTRTWMPGDVRAEISEALGVPDAPWATALAPADAQVLLELVHDVRERQRTALRNSIEEALTHVPRVLRGALRAVLFA